MVWSDRTKTVSQRLNEVRQSGHDLYAQYSALLKEWPKLELLEKGESLRRIFKTVTLFWEKQFHPSEETPGRPRKTNRDGRYSYKLLADEIGWELSASNLDGSR